MPPFNAALSASFFPSLVTVAMQEGVGMATLGFSLIGIDVGIFDPGSDLTEDYKVRCYLPGTHQ